MDIKYNTTNCKYFINAKCAPDYAFCKDCHLNKPVQKSKFKKVVKEIPNQKLIVTYNWLREQKACQDGIDAFVNEFGKEAEYDKVVEILKENLNIIKSEIDEWLHWLKGRKHLLENKENCEYVSSTKIMYYDKIYIAKHKVDNTLYKIFFGSQIIKLLSFIKNLNIIYKSIDEVLNHNDVYEFDSFDDFIDWYKENEK
jgi:hypothetical protein